MPETRGFCTTKTQEADLIRHGVPERAIYVGGRGGETLDICLDSFRGRPGQLIIAHDLRVFGNSKRAVADVMASLEKSGIRVTDISHPEDGTVAELVQRASVAISGYRFRDRRAAKRLGAKGGLGKGIGAQNIRDGLAPKWLVDRIVDCREIPWGLKEGLLSPHFSASTLRRHYGAKATNA